MRRALAAAAAAALVVAVPAHACDEATHARAVHARAHGRRGAAPLVIGDSTLILAAPLLGRMGIEADAHGCRQFDQGLGVVARRHGRRRPDAVVLALGANGAVSRRQIARARHLLGPRRFLLLVTPRNLRSSAAAMRAVARAHPDDVLTLDWARYSAGHASWFAGDGLHVGPSGARAYARFIRAGLAPFLGPPRRGRPLDLPLRADAPANTPCGALHAHGRVLDVFLTRGGGHLSCAYARRLVARPRLRPRVRWRFYDWRMVGRGPWSEVLARRDRSVVIAAVDRGRVTMGA